MSQITKKAVREALGMDTDSALAQFFGVSRAAVAQWEEDDPLPQARQMWLHLHLPDKFPLADTGARGVGPAGQG